MDYDAFELMAFWVLSCAPGVLLVVAGIITQTRKSGTGWMPRYLVLGILGCLIYAMFAGGIVRHLFPPPYVSGLSEGRGLDLRGIGFFVGAWIGALVGVACELVTAAGTAITRRFRVARSSAS